MLEKRKLQGKRKDPQEDSPGRVGQKAVKTSRSSLSSVGTWTPTLGGVTDQRRSPAELSTYVGHKSMMRKWSSQPTPGCISEDSRPQKETVGPWEGRGGDVTGDDGEAEEVGAVTGMRPPVCRPGLTCVFVSYFPIKKKKGKVE